MYSHYANINQYYYNNIIYFENKQKCIIKNAVQVKTLIKNYLFRLKTFQLSEVVPTSCLPTYHYVTTCRSWHQILNRYTLIIIKNVFESIRIFTSHRPIIKSTVNACENTLKLWTIRLLIGVWNHVSALVWCRFFYVCRSCNWQVAYFDISILKYTQDHISNNII